MPGILVAMVGIAFRTMRTPCVEQNAGNEFKMPSKTQDTSIWDEPGCEQAATALKNMAQGIYEVYISVLGFNILHVGYGYVERSVFHSQYHVTSGHDIWYEDMRMSPYYSDQELDQVTYGGPWCLKKMDSSKPVYIYHPYTDRLSKS